MPGHGTNAIETVVAFRPRTDLVAEADPSGWISLLNTNWIASAFDTNFRIRIGVECSSLVASYGEYYQLYYSHNEGSFSQITTSSSVIKSVNSEFAGYDDDDTSTQLITSGYYQTTNQLINEGDDETGAVSWNVAEGSLQYCETEWVLQLVDSDLTRGDTIELRLRDYAGAALSGGYTYVPIISVQAPRIDIKGKEVQIKGKEVRVK